MLDWSDTVPPGFKYGASWEEDILFIEPETVCVDTNTTIDYTVASNPNSTVSVVDLVLTDRGGFVNINRSYPLIDLSDPQKNAKLYERAWKAAWMTNAWTMLYYVRHLITHGFRPRQITLKAFQASNLGVC